MTVRWMELQHDEDVLNSFLESIDRIDQSTIPEDHINDVYTEYLANGMVVLRSFCSAADQQIMADWYHIRCGFGNTVVQHGA